jgi:DNA processing protein
MESALEGEPESDDSKHPDVDYETLLQTLSYDPASADELAEQSGLTIDQVSSMLLILELEQKIDTQAGGRYSRRPA